MKFLTKQWVGVFDEIIANRNEVQDEKATMKRKWVELRSEEAEMALNTHQMQITNQNTYFNKRFGRSDFDPIDSKEALGNSIAYLLKYVHKQEGKIVYSKGLPQFFISDIMDDDVACRTGIEDRKLVLFDDFLCIDDGEVIGKVSAETIAKMRKCN